MGHGKRTGTILAKSRSVSRSSTMLECLLVTNTRISDSIGWYTYRTCIRKSGERSGLHVVRCNPSVRGIQQADAALAWLPQCAHLSSLYRVVLALRADQLGEGGEVVLDLHPRHLDKLASKQDLALLREDCHRQADLRAHVSKCHSAILNGVRCTLSYVLIT